ncbi:MAG: SagB/ThcOx family dehydrogenase, partial [Acidobacteriota bacterium]
EGPSVEDSQWKQRYSVRRSYRQFGQQPVQMEQLASLLSGLREVELDGEPQYRYGSAGGAYPVQTYLYLHPGRVSGIEGGLYYYHPAEHRLHPLSPQAEFDRSIHGWINQPIFDQAAFSIFFIAEIAAIGPFYGPVARDYCLIEAGLMSQLLEETAPHSGLGLCQIGVGGIDFESLRDHFQLNESHLLVHSLMGGPIDQSLGKAAFTPAPLEQEWEEGKL